MLQPFPEQNEPRTVPRQNLKPISPLRPEDEDRFRERVVPQRLTDQSHKAIRALAEVHGLRGHQHLHPSRNRDHVAAFTARSTSRSQPRSTPRSARTTAPAISMVITPETVTPTAAATSSSRASLTIGTNIGTSSAGNVSKPARAALRQPNRCCGDMSCRRATSDTTAPGAYDCATIRPLVATLQRRRRPTPTRISTRPRGSEASSIWSTICANRYAKVGSHLAAQIARYKVGAEFRLRPNQRFGLACHPWLPPKVGRRQLLWRALTRMAHAERAAQQREPVQ